MAGSGILGGIFQAANRVPRLSTWPSALLFALVAFVPVDFGAGASEAKAHHWPSTCGGEGQKPCKLWQHVPSCKPGLVEVALTRCKKDQGDIGKNIKEDARDLVNPNANPDCGGIGQQACVTSCDRGLVMHLGRGTCIQSEATLIGMASSVAGEVGPVLGAIGRTLIDCGAENILAQVNMRNDAQAKASAQRLIDRNCITVLLEEAQRAGYNTVTVGYGNAAAFIIGGEVEVGIAYDVGFEYFPSAYSTYGIDLGTQVEATPGALVVSLYKGNNQPGPEGFGGDAHGVTWGGKAAVGGGMALWWNYDGSFAGASAAIGSGIEFEIAYVRNTTLIANPLEVAWENSRAGQQQPGSVAPSPVAGYQPSQPPVRRRPAPPRPVAPPRQPTVGEAAVNAADAIATGFAEAQRLRREEEARTTWFEVCNKARYNGKKVGEIGLAFAFWAEASRGGQEGWMSNGLHILKKNKCDRWELPGDEDGYGMDYTVMLFANIRDGDERPAHWAGRGLEFCVDPANRILRAADQQDCDDPTPVGQHGMIKVRGIPFEVSRGGGRFEFRDGGLQPGSGYLNNDN